jgi:hypothetical protein
MVLLVAAERGQKVEGSEIEKGAILVYVFAQVTILVSGFAQVPVQGLTEFFDIKQLFISSFVDSLFVLHD